MNSKTLMIGIAIIVIAGAAYYFGTSESKSATQGTQAESATPAPGSNAGEMYANGESTQVNAAMVGTWKSKEDPKFTREFKADGTVTDRYEGEASATETAKFVTVDPSVIEVPGVPASALSGTAVIRIDFASGPMFFSINTLTETELAMTNLSGRGNILAFTKVQ